ncbi:MAG: hypothetical protein WKG32_02955 [Gemmatimonadaceae bacterium]
MTITRRRFVSLGATALGAAALAAASAASCGGGPTDDTGASSRPGGDGRLRARPGAPTGTPSPGALGALAPLDLASGRDGLLYVPKRYAPDRPASLVLMLHGAGGSARGGINPFLPLADELGLILLAPDSRGQTWDVILGAYGPDVVFIDRALTSVFARYAVSPGRLSVEGFSDGASYALSLGLTNGDLFSRAVAFSPCFSAPASRHGTPRIFVSHGMADAVLPIDGCSRRLVPRLRSAGYEVDYREFDGPHTVPAEMARGAAEWLAG